MILQNPCLLVLILLHYTILVLISAATTIISPNSSLYASNPDKAWSSPNSTFHVGFLPSNASPSSSPSFIAVISYSGRIPIWSAGNGATVDSSGALHFLANGNLRLVNGSNTTIWESNTADRGVSFASLDDSGNFILQTSSTSIWSTFDNPTDTIVPTQNFTVAMVLRSGLYSFNLNRSGTITLTWNDNIVYWNHGLNSSINVSLSSPSLGLQSIGILSIFDVALQSRAIMAYSSDFAEGNDILRFLKLDNDGNLRIYSSSRDSGIATERWAAVSDQCQVFGYCGNFGICSYDEKNAICKCPSENFMLTDSKDGRKGCKRKMEIEDCPGSETMLTVEHTRFLTYPPDTNSLVFFAGISVCGSNCLVNNKCIASTSLSDGTGLCHYKTTDLFVSGYQIPALPSTSYVKVCEPVMIQNRSLSFPYARERRRTAHGWIVVVVVVVSAILVVTAVEGVLWWFCCRNRVHFGGISAQHSLLEYASGVLVKFSYNELHRATNQFKEKVGAGSFGVVCKGVVDNGTIVAVKQLDGIEKGEKEFRVEVATISSTHHLNLVRLIGFCSEGPHKLLVYEFVENLSLDNFLFVKEDECSRKFLNWVYRFNIALGTARAITYLHEECRHCIVHCNIKPENILLDENYNAKVSDFGLVKLVNPNDHRYQTSSISVRGSRGYLAPEWHLNMPITSKSDVYSYGMVLLEIVSGRRNFEVSLETNQKKFFMWAYEEFEKGNVMKIVDKRLVEAEVNMDQIIRAIKLCFWCIQEQPFERPMMGKVVQILEGTTLIDRAPAPKALIKVPTIVRTTTLQQLSQN